MNGQQVETSQHDISPGRSKRHSPIWTRTCCRKRARASGRRSKQSSKQKEII